MDEMVATGWIDEGVAFCSPANQLANNRSVSIDAFVIEKTDDDFMRETYGFIETEHELIGRNRRKVWRMFNQPEHYCVETSPEFGCPLPEYCVTAWLSSGPIPGRDPSYSKMVIVFFCDNITGMCPGGLFTIYLYNLDWDGKAWTAEEIEKDRKSDDWVLRDQIVVFILVNVRVKFRSLKTWFWKPGANIRLRFLRDFGADNKICGFHDQLLA